MSRKVVNVGIIGCGEVSQVIHIPTLNHMSDFYNIVYLCDISPGALEQCSKKVINHIPATTTKAEEVCKSTDVDVVFVANADEFHTTHTLLALKHDKHVFVEKPMAMTIADAQSIVEAESQSQGSVMVGYMRRYATAFIDAVREIGGMDKILYARVRDIIGPNSTFVGQSATFPKQFTDFQTEDVEEKSRLAEKIATEGLARDCGVQPHPELLRLYRLLGNLGSHDLSAMREALGMPQAVAGASLNFPFWSVLFKYANFSVTYESGLYDVPLFDAHIEVYSKNKSVRVQYDTPYVKGLPIIMHIREGVDGGYQERTIRKTYEDAYTLEMKALYDMVTEGKAVKTNPEDALQDLRIFRMVMQAMAQ